MPAPRQALSKTPRRQQQPDRSRKQTQIVSSFITDMEATAALM
jgi:hypothetical protein